MAFFAASIVERKGHTVCSMCGTAVARGVSFCPACRGSFDGRPVPPLQPSAASHSDGTKDLFLLGAVGWLCWPVVVYFLIKDILALNAATGQPAEVIIPLRRRAILMAVVVAVDLFLALTLGSFVLFLCR